MRILPALALLVLTTTACAPVGYRVYGGAMLPRMGGQASLQDSAGTNPLGAVRNDLDDALDQGDTEVAPYLRGEVEWEDHHLTVSGFGFSNDGNGTLANDFGDIAAGSSVATQVDFLNVKAAWTYDVVDLDVGEGRLRLAPGVGVHTLINDIDVQSGASFEQVETSAVVPMPMAQAELVMGPVAAVLDVGVIDVDLEDADGTYWDIEALARVRPTGGFELIGGYRYVQMDTDGRADGRDFDADLDVRGFFLGAGFTF